MGAIPDVFEQGKPELEEARFGLLRCVDYLPQAHRERTRSTTRYLVGVRSRLVRP